MNVDLKWLFDQMKRLGDGEITNVEFEQLSDEHMFSETPYKGMKFERLGGWKVKELPKGYVMPFFKFENGDLVTRDKTGKWFIYREVNEPIMSQ